METGSPQSSLSVDDLQRVLRILKQATGHLDPRALYQAIVEAIPRELGSFHLVNLAMVFPATGRLVTVAVSGDDATQVSEAYGGLMTQPIDTGITGWVARNGKTYYAPNAPADPLYFSGANLAPRPGSELALPILVDEEVVAVLNLESRSVDAFSPPMIGMLEAVADHVGTAIQNALLHDQAREDSARLEAALARLRTAEAAFAAMLTGRAWIVDGSGRIEVVVFAEQGRIQFHAAMADAIVDELTDSARGVWENALARALRGQPAEAVVTWKDRMPRAGHIRLFPLQTDGQRVLVLA